MNEDERRYFLTLSYHRQLEYLRDSWGASVTVCVDSIREPRGRTVLVGSAGVLDALVASELNFPPPVVLTTRLQPTTSVDKFIGDLLALWAKTVKEHLSASAD